MDLYDLKKFGKTVKTNDNYWQQSLFWQNNLEKVLTEGTDEDIYTLIKNPDLYKGRS